VSDDVSELVYVMEYLTDSSPWLASLGRHGKDESVKPEEPSDSFDERPVVTRHEEHIESHNKEEIPKLGATDLLSMFKERYRILKSYGFARVGSSYTSVEGVEVRNKSLLIESRDAPQPGAF